MNNVTEPKTSMNNELCVFMSTITVDASERATCCCQVTSFLLKKKGLILALHSYCVSLSMYIGMFTQKHISRKTNKYD